MKINRHKWPSHINTPTSVIADLRAPEFLGIQPRSVGQRPNGDNRWCSNVLSQNERDALDYLVGLALLNTAICERLIVKHDCGLLAAFGLSENAKNWVLGIEAQTLKDFAQAIVAATRSPYTENPARMAA